VSDNVRTGRARHFRWSTASDVLDALRRRPGITRAELARDLGLSSGSAAEVTARLRELRLLEEVPAPPSGRGRPTVVPRPHPEGPLVLALEIRRDDWRSGLAALDGRLSPLAEGGHSGPDPAPLLARLREHVAAAADRHGHRLRAVSVAIAGIVAGGRVVDASSLGWPPLDLAGPDGPAGGTGLPLLLGNDAALAGVAEARTGASTGHRTALHLLLESGLGGVFTVDGQARGEISEFGHLPFADRALRCHCGALGCWQLAVGGEALARALGEPPPALPREYALAVLRRARDEPAAASALAGAATALGSGIGGLVNALDPEVVTVGGLAGPLRAAAPEAFRSAYRDALMAFRRAAPPPVHDAAHGELGVLRGAAAVGLDRVTGEAQLAAWAARS
jgi:predicted NBD/HSP70 family sugar kinase